MCCVSILSLYYTVIPVNNIMYTNMDYMTCNRELYYIVVDFFQLYLPNVIVSGAYTHS